MGLFDKKQKTPEILEPEVYLDIRPEEKKLFEEICSKEGISCSYEPGPGGSVRCVFPAKFEQVILKYLTLEPEEPVEKKQDINDLIAGTQKPKQPDFLERMGLAESQEPPSPLESQWAEETMYQELRKPAEPTEEKPKKKRKSLGRKKQIMTRLTDAELQQFQRRVKKSGLSQGEYLRSAALTGQIVINERSEIDVAILDEIVKIRAELGRQGGLLKMVIKPNEGQRELAPEEWAALIQAVRGMEKTKEQIGDIMGRMNNGK